jgi:hypothetical protein
MIPATAPPAAPAIAAPAVDVLRCRDLPAGALALLLARYGLELVEVAGDRPIPCSFWGEPEAGIAGRRVFARGDTPVHSALHEACHLICAGAARRAAISTDAGGDFAEEDAVCYLQIVLAGELPEMGRDRMLADMDAWGYTFRLGSARAWFEGDAKDAQGWLAERGLLDAAARAICRASE